MFNSPYFCKDFIMSNELCQILVNLLHQQQKHRYTGIPIVRQDLLRLRKNIFETPLLMRRLLSHPVLPGEQLTPMTLEENIDFREH